ncbi:hypothetical protein MLD52_21430 [Puniceicoccaceae bacterium K14]|nr:hypothetical protein [Puniceicoccaceae bacterium K14]
MIANYKNWVSIFFASVILSMSASLSAQESVCAVVKFEIEQELTLERQGFEGRMTISNDSPFDLENTKVELAFYNEEGDPVVATTDASDTEGALFFFRDLDQALDGTVGIASGDSKSFVFTIIPAPDAGGENAAGIYYSVGALVSYNSDQAEESINVLPDDILVLPMPRLRLDYFFPSEVIADDPFTPEVEEAEPFDYVLRVSNEGYASANNLKLASNQPQIADNPNGLLIDFSIVGSSVDEVSSEETMLADFGDLGAGETSIARWLLMSSLAGRITEVNTEIQHADELGGTLTSLIESFNTYRLVGSVDDDTPGYVSDEVRDALAIGSDGVSSLPSSLFSLDLGSVVEVPTLKIFKSNSAEPITVENFSNATSLETSSSSSWVLKLSSIPSAVDVPVFARLDDPANGNMEITSIVRSDGKLLSKNNVWFSRKNIGPNDWEYYINLYDTGVDGALSLPVEYNLTLSPKSSENVPPIFEDLGTVFAASESPIDIVVEAVDFDGPLEALELSAPGLLPSGMNFADNGNSAATFSWTPSGSLLGKTIPIVVEAFDGLSRTLETINIAIIEESQILESWKSTFWPGVSDGAIIGNLADPDGDQLTNLLEYALGLDPTDITSDGLPVLIVAEYAVDEYRLALEMIVRENDPLLNVYGIASTNTTLDEDSWDIIPAGNHVDSPNQEAVPVGFKRMLIFDTQEISNTGPRRYMKVRVERSEAN